MPEDVQIAELSAAVNGGEYSPETIRIDLAVNAFATAKVGIVTPDADIVQTPMSAATLERIAELQKARLAGRIEPDLLIGAIDGNGGSLKFSGFTSAPLLNVSSTSTADQISGLGYAAIVQALDLGIYNSAGSEEAREGTSDGEASLGPILAAKDGNITGTILEVSDILFSNFAAILETMTLPLSQEIFQTRHTINAQKPMDVWREMLVGNDVQFESWTAAFKKEPMLGRKLAVRVREIISSKAPGFWNKVRHLMGEFQMFYVPELDGSGYFKRSDEKVGEPSTTIKVSISNIGVADGATQILQPGGVVMTRPASLEERIEKQANPLNGMVIAAYPTPLTLGYIQEQTPPPWLMDVDGPILGSEIDKSTDADGKKNLSLKDYNTRKEAGFKFRQEVDVLSAGMLTELCEVIFKELQLAHSTVSIQLPLDFTLSARVGDRVTVDIQGPKGESGGSFTAFVRSLTHTIDLRAGKQLNSGTSLQCSHVNYGE